MRRIAHHRQMRETFEHGKGRDIHSVASRSFKSADAALAKNHFIVAAGKNVFGRQQQLLDGGRDAAFEKHRFADLPELAQQVEVLHVASANLQDIGVLDEKRDLSLVHHLADHQQAMAIGRFAQDAKTILAKPLETVGRAARLESASPNDLRARLGNNLRRAFDLVFILNAARASHSDHARTADFDRPELDHGAAGLEVAAGNLIGRDDAVSLFDPIHNLEIRWIKVLDRTHAAEHGVHNTSRAMDREARTDQAIDNGLNLRLSGALLHDD